MSLSVDFPSDSSISSVPFEVSVPRSVRSVNVNLNMNSSPLDSSSVNGDSSCDGTGEAEVGILSSNHHSLHWMKYVTCKSHNDKTAMEKNNRQNTELVQKVELAENFKKMSEALGSKIKAAYQCKEFVVLLDKKRGRS